MQGIVGLDADVVGLIEIENNGPSADPRVGPDAVQSLVDAVNAALPAGAAPYVAIDDPDVTAPNFLGGTFGTDAIKVAIIYRPSVVTPQGGPVSDPALIDPADPAFPGESLFDRPPLAQTFARADGTGVPFTLIVNHLKSKGSLSTNCDQSGGGLQGNCNDLRIRQAQGVLDLIEGAGLENVAVFGDLNAYTLEDPIDVFEGAGFTSPVDTFLPVEDRYSYVFEGERGELDHALVDGDLAPLVTGADIWHINSIEPPAKDYTSFNNLALYEPNAFRSSDHDPVLVGLDLTPAPPVPTCRGLAATIVGTDAGELLSGTAGADVIVALGGNDIVVGLGGDDVVCAGDGVDVVLGGAGPRHPARPGRRRPARRRGGRRRAGRRRGRGHPRPVAPGPTRCSAGPGVDVLDGGPGADTEDQDGDLAPYDLRPRPRVPTAAPAGGTSRVGRCRGRPTGTREAVGSGPTRPVRNPPPRPRRSRGNSGRSGGPRRWGSAPAPIASRLFRWPLSPRDPGRPGPGRGPGVSGPGRSTPRGAAPRRRRWSTRRGRCARRSRGGRASSAAPDRLDDRREVAVAAPGRARARRRTACRRRTRRRRRPRRPGQVEAAAPGRVARACAAPPSSAPPAASTSPSARSRSGSRSG